jgi:hypothetical protein
MPYSLPLPPALAAHWKVKILDHELLVEEPHATIVFRVTRWRYSLRRQCFMDDRPPGREVNRRVLAIVQEQIEVLRQEWDRLHGDVNPV